MKIVVRVLLVGIIIAVGLGFGRPNPPNDLAWQLSGLTRPVGFDWLTWEVRTLSSRASGAVMARFHAAPVSGPRIVERYEALTRDIDRLRGQRDRLWAQQSVSGHSEGLDQLDQRLAVLHAQREAQRARVEQVVGGEIDAQLRSLSLPAGQFAIHAQGQFPFIQASIVPIVFFRLGSLPDALFVAPRDRIAIIDSVFVEPNLPPNAVDHLENSADGLAVSSIVSPIGGFAAYPSMVPENGSLRALLVTISHEWTHHYLIFHPLGQHYFASYQMREINETVADMVGHEVGTAVYSRYYPPSLRPAPAEAPPPPPPGRPDFLTLMLGIRHHVEGYLARHDVAGADRYMAAQQKELARQGYYVRRLNTAYLAFFGAYAGSGNPYEAHLRLLRQRAGSLAAFLAQVSTIQQPSDLDRLVERSSSPN